MLMSSDSLSSTTEISTSHLIPKNGTIFNFITNLLNRTQLYEHQIGDFLEPEKYSARGVHIIIWTFSILTYVLAIPIALRMFRFRAQLKMVDYFSFHIILCAFIAWIPSLILLLYHWFQLFTLKLCRLHYVILETNETVPIFFVFYMVIERFLYSHPSWKQRYIRFFHVYCIYSCPIFTWLLIMFVYALASPFIQRNSNSIISEYTNKYCQYDFSKLRSIGTARSVIYFCLFVPSFILIGFVLRYFYLLRGTNQIPTIQKLWIIRATSLLCLIVFYNTYLFYLEHIAETYNSFLLASTLRSTFHLVQIITIICTEPYWLELLLERFSCLCRIFTDLRRKTTTPIRTSAETEINTLPHSSSTGHYSLIDNNFHDEFDEVTSGFEPTLRVDAQS